MIWEFILVEFPLLCESSGPGNRFNDVPNLVVAVVENWNGDGCRGVAVVVGDVAVAVAVVVTVDDDDDVDDDGSRISSMEYMLTFPGLSNETES